MSKIHYIAKPVLDRPALIMAFSGWPNAGEVSTGTLAYLDDKFQPQPLATIPAEAFYDFTKERPTGMIESGEIKGIFPPDLRFSYARTSEGQRDIIFFTAAEPHFAWDSLGEHIFNLAKEMKVWGIFTLGGSYDYVPHWSPAAISAVFSDRLARDLLANHPDISLSIYNGPVSIHSYLLYKAREHGLPAVSLWGHCPIYIQTGNVKIHYALVEIIKKSLGLSVDTTDLAASIKDMDRQIDELVAKDQRLKEYLDDLTKEYKGQRGTVVRPSPSTGEARGKVISIDQFLRRTES